MPDAPLLDPGTGGVVGAIAAGLTGLGAGLTGLMKRASLTDEDRKTLAQMQDALVRIEAALAKPSAPRVACTSSSDAASTQQQLQELRRDLEALTSSWPRARERLESIERDAANRGRRLEEVERLAKSLHVRLDGLSQQLKEQIPPGLTAAMEGAIAGVQALRHSIEDRIDRRPR